MSERALICLAAVALLAVLGACAPRGVTIGALEPTPRIALPARAERLALDLGRTPDTIRVDADGLPPIEVRSFRRTMQTGFDRGLARAFQPADALEGELTLSLEITHLRFADRREAAGDPAPGAAAVVLVHGGHPPVGPKAPRRLRYARLSFQAVLRDRTGEIGRISGRASSREPARSGTRQALETCLVSAIEVLYQQIGRDLFVRRTATREARP